MRHYRRPYLSVRPAFLLTAQLPYDGLLKSPGRFAGRLCGRAFRSVEGGEAPRGHVLQRRIFLSRGVFVRPASRMVAPHLAPGAGHVIIYHLLTEGRASARLFDGDRIALDAGDLVIFPHGDPHIIENGPPTKTVDMAKELARIVSRG